MTFIICNLKPFFAHRIAILGLLKLNIKARQDKSEFLTANLLLVHFITLKLNWN